MHIQYKDGGHICTETVHQYTDRHISHTLPHSRTLTYTHPFTHSFEIWCHIFVLTLE